MSKHFEDTQYYLKRAGEHAKLGIKEKLDTVQGRVKALVGTEEEPEPSTVESILEEVKEIEQKAEGEARDALGNAREKLEAYRTEE